MKINLFLKLEFIYLLSVFMLISCGEYEQVNSEEGIEPEIVRVEEVIISKQSLSLIVGEEYSLSYEIIPSDATNQQVKWMSDNDYVATVEDGKVKALNKGTATILVMAEDGGKYTKCNITVSKPEVVHVESVTLSESELTISVGNEHQLIAEVLPLNAYNKKLDWSSSNTDVAIVNDGKVVALKEGFTVITATSQDGGKYAYCRVTVSSVDDNVDVDEFDFSPSGVDSGYEYVDLGLSVKWATCNIGADSIEEFGEYYAWGESNPYNIQLTYRNYRWNHCPCSPNAVLSSIYDTATKLMGESWRMPTADEQEELIKGCDWTWVDNLNNTYVCGYVATSKRNGKSIFLPATKFISGTGAYKPKENDAIYWSASTHGTSGKLNFDAGATAECLMFETIEGMVAPVKMETWAMGSGATIRPVLGTPNYYYPDPDDLTHDEYETQRQGYSVSGIIGGYTYVDLGFPSRTLWATYNVGADMPGEYGDFFAWGETSPKESYAYETYKFFSGYSDGKTSLPQYTKYVYDKNYGPLDGKMKLDEMDDAAYVNWGKDWRIPTAEQCRELSSLCDFWRKDIVVNGKTVIGYVGESKLNGNRIYIPAAGWEHSYGTNDHMQLWYWTCDICQQTNNRAIYMLYYEHTGLIEVDEAEFGRYMGLPVRPVVNK